MAARFFLGAFEAASVSGVPYLLPFFYLKHELGLRCGVYVRAAAFATCFRYLHRNVAQVMNVVLSCSSIPSNRVYDHR